MNEDIYMSDRVDDQIGWYDRRSQAAQRSFKRMRGFEIIAAASIPLIAGFGADIPHVNLLLALIGAAIAVTSALTSLNQYQENWTAYRTTCESLKHEKFMFLTRAEPYHEAEPFPLFVRRVEQLISKENSAWSQYTQAEVERTAPSSPG